MNASNGQVIFFKRGSISAKDRKLLLRRGCVPVEVEDPSQVVVGVPAAKTDGNLLLQAALAALNKKGFYRTDALAAFGSEIAERLLIPATPPESKEGGL